MINLPSELGVANPLGDQGNRAMWGVDKRLIARVAGGD